MDSYETNYNPPERKPVFTDIYYFAYINLQLAVNTVYILSFGDSVTPGPGSGKDEKNITFRIGFTDDNEFNLTYLEINSYYSYDGDSICLKS
jgi:hypothetical protein